MNRFVVLYTLPHTSMQAKQGKDRMYHQVGGTHGDDIALVRIDCLSAHLSKRFSRASHGNTSAALLCFVTEAAFL